MQYWYNFWHENVKNKALVTVSMAPKYIIDGSHFTRPPPSKPTWMHFPWMCYLPLLITQWIFFQNLPIYWEPKHVIVGLFEARNNEWGYEVEIDLWQNFTHKKICGLCQGWGLQFVNLCDNFQLNCVMKWP